MKCQALFSLINNEIEYFKVSFAVVVIIALRTMMLSAQVLVNCLADKASPGKVWFGKLTSST